MQSELTTNPGASSRGSRHFIVKPSGWQCLTLFVALLVMVPLTVILFAWTDPAWDIWKHLKETLLNRLLINTAIMVCGVSLGTLMIGVSLAWLTGTCDFPGRQLFSWMLILKTTQ